MRLSGYYGFVWESSGVVCDTVSFKPKNSWEKAIETFDYACEHLSHNLRSRGYDPSWDDAKKKRWFKKNGGSVKPLIIEVSST